MSKNTQRIITRLRFILSIALMITLGFSDLNSNNKNIESHCQNASCIKSIHVKPKEQNKAKKAIIFDLGDTLLTVNKFGIAQEIGIGNFILYPLLDWKNPMQIHELAMKILDLLDAQNDCALFDSSSKKLPQIMGDWLSGLESGKSISIRAQALIGIFEKMGYFVSEREKHLVEQAITVMFDPIKLAQNTYPINGAINFLNRCSKNTDNNLFILSNWDPESFEYLYNSKNGQKIFKFFAAENIIISGKIGLLKPQKSIYTYLIKNFNLNPADCIVIDDLPQNIKAAQEAGMTGILFEDYCSLGRQLSHLGAL